MKKLVIGGVSALAVVGVAGTAVYLSSPHQASADTELAAASEQVAAQVVNGQPVDAAQPDQQADQQPDQQADQQPDQQAGRQPNQNPGQRAWPLRRARRLARRAGVHGEASVRTKNGFIQIAWQRGVLTGRSGDNLTVRSLDGTVWLWTASGTTRVRKDGKKATVTDLATNDYVVIAGQASSGNRHTAGAVVVPKKVPARATQAPTPAPTSS